MSVEVSRFKKGKVDKLKIHKVVDKLVENDKLILNEFERSTNGKTLNGTVSPFDTTNRV
jgi:hypothetical protein